MTGDHLALFPSMAAIDWGRAMCAWSNRGRLAIGGLDAP